MVCNQNINKITLYLDGTRGVASNKAPDFIGRLQVANPAAVSKTHSAIVSHGSIILTMD